MPELISHAVAAPQCFHEDASKKTKCSGVLHRLLSDPGSQRVLQQWISALPVGAAVGTCDGSIIAANALFSVAAGEDAQGNWRLLFKLPQNLAEVSELILEKDEQCRPWHISRLSNDFVLIIVGETSRQACGKADANFVREWLRLKAFEMECILPAKKPLEASKEVIHAILDSLADQIVVVDGAGRIVVANEPWRKFARALSVPFSFSSFSRADYIALLETAIDPDMEDRDGLVSGLRDVMGGRVKEFRSDFAFLKDGERRWMRLWVSALPALRNDAVVIVQRDVTLHRAAEQGLWERDTLFQRVIEDSVDGIFLYDTQGRFLMTNPANAEVLGCKSGQIVGKTLNEVFSPEVARVINDHNLLVLSTGQSLEFELPLETPAGRRTVLVRKSLYHNHRKEVVGIFGIARDITLRKRAEEALERSERHFRALIENSADRLALLAKDGTILYASPSSQRVSGYNEEEQIGTNFMLWIHPDDVPATSRVFKEILELPGGSLIRDYRSLSKNAQWRWMESTITNLLQDPSVRAVVVNERDISERKYAESEMRRFAAIVESSNDAILGEDLGGSITSWNPAAQRIFGYAAHEIVGQSARLLLPPDHEKEYAELTATVLRGQGTADFETVRVGKNGKRIEVSITLSPIRGQDRQVIGISSIYRDITERRCLEKEILEISESEKQRLGQDLHDDLCQILVGIALQGNILYDELGRQGIKQAADAKQLTELARSAVEHARSLAKGLSPLNLVDSGLMSALESLVSDTEQIFRVPCVFECNTPVMMKDGVVANNLYRIAQEALHNAVKHSGATKVSVSLGIYDGQKIVLVVCDNGSGFSETVREVPDGAYSGRTGGHGMHIMRYRARTIGATLEFKPNPDAGTSVVCALPGTKLTGD